MTRKGNETLPWGSLFVEGRNQTAPLCVFPPHGGVVLPDTCSGSLHAHVVHHVGWDVLVMMGDRSFGCAMLTKD